MSSLMARLDERIRRLKTDLGATQDWRKLRFEVEKHGGRWHAPNGSIYELKDGVIYQWLGEQGVSEVIVTALDSEIPYVAVLSLDLQHTPPEKREAALKELDEMARNVATVTELITIVPNDWLSKISLARWNDKEAWKTRLRPTRMTLETRRRRRRQYDPNLIYPGDQFEVVR